MDFKISVITPSFNSGKYIEKAISSVLDQDYTNFEHIIIDGGSTDDTLNTLQKYPHLVWTSEPDRGQVHAMNKGFARSTGDIIVYLNADDYFLCDAFSSVIPFFQKKHQFVVGDIVVQKPSEYFINVPKIQLSQMIRHWEMNAFPYNPIGYFYKKEVQRNIPFDENFPNMMDLRFLLESATSYEFVKINSLLGVYRCLDSTKTLEDQKNSNYWTKENFSFLQKYITLLPEIDQNQYEKDRIRGYQLQREWQQPNKITQETTCHKTTQKRHWKGFRKTITGILNGTNKKETPLQQTPAPKISTFPTSNPHLERYQLRALDVAMSYFDFQGKTILEIGGDMEFQVAREMVRRGANRIVSLNYSPYFTSKKITNSIESINMDIRNLDTLHETFDMVFGVAILEHLNNLDHVLEKISFRLKPDGIVYIHGGPIWTSFLGHHVWIHADDGSKYEFNNNNPIPDWGHLLYNESELYTILSAKGIPTDHCQLIIDYIYKSDRLSRYTADDFIKIANSSRLSPVSINKIEWKKPDHKLQALLQLKTNLLTESYESGEIELILKKNPSQIDH